MRPHLERKHDDIRSEYIKQYKKGLRHDVIVKELSWRFYMSETSISSIVWQSGGYRKTEDKNQNNNQLEL